MAVDHIRYDILAQDALRGVVRNGADRRRQERAAGRASFLHHVRHHGAEGVKLSPRLREQYPEEMTIVLQHQFWDLKVTDDAFEVGLSFGGVPERLLVPFDAIKGFFDPSVQFGLQFETDRGGAGRDCRRARAEARASRRPEGRRSGRRRPRPAHRLPRRARLRPAGSRSGAATSRAGQAGAEVVRLDRFRKK